MKAIVLIPFLLGFTACQGGMGSTRKHSGESSRAVNKQEEVAYKQALIRCHKTGGTRIVKLNGILRCF